MLQASGSEHWTEPVGYSGFRSNLKSGCGAQPCPHPNPPPPAGEGRAEPRRKPSRRQPSPANGGGNLTRLRCHRWLPSLPRERGRVRVGATGPAGAAVGGVSKTRLTNQIALLGFERTTTLPAAGREMRASTFGIMGRRNVCSEAGSAGQTSPPKFAARWRRRFAPEVCPSANGLRPSECGKPAFGWF